MENNQKIAHDIAVALLPKSLEFVNTELYLFNETDRGTLNSNEIVGLYHELYHEILDELNSRQ